MKILFMGLSPNKTFQTWDQTIIGLCQFATNRTFSGEFYLADSLEFATVKPDYRIYRFDNESKNRLDLAGELVSRNPGIPIYVIDEKADNQMMLEYLGRLAVSNGALWAPDLDSVADILINRRVPDAIKAESLSLGEQK